VSSPLESFSCKAQLGRSLRCAALAGLLVFRATSGEAAPVVRQVLVLLSVDSGVLAQDYLTTNFRIDLDQRNESPVNVVQVIVGPTGFVSAPEQAIVDYIQSIYADRPKPDLVVTLAGPATVFARKYRRQLFPDAPLLFGAVDERYLGAASLEDNETAVAVNGDFPRTIDDILQLLPETRQVFMVTGSGPLAKFWHRQLEGEFARFRDRLTFLWSDDLSLQEIVRRCASLPSHSAVFYLTFGTDSEGGNYADERVLAELHATANAPLFGPQSVMLGHGIVGGGLLPVDRLSQSVVNAAIRILNGEKPRGVTIPTQQRGQPVFDWRELQRWGIAESRLPAGSSLRYRPPDLWEEHRAALLGTAGALALQSLLIAGLLSQRRARQLAELESRKNLAIAADVSRRETMSALTSSIGHELGQPLGSIIHNAQALEMMVSANGATSETIGEILSDIQSQGVRATQIIDRHRTMLKSHEMAMRPIDVQAVIDETLALVAHDMTMRQVSATVAQPLHPCIVEGDQVLLQQVLVNLVMNAMDAMAETPPPRRHITLGCGLNGSGVEISVRDEGPGLPAQLLETLFTPFVTTKARGLGIGLTIVRSIVDAHGGTIVARNNSAGGATFTVTLPLATGAVAGALH
jgi:signal transduction histidine kinase